MKKKKKKMVIGVILLIIVLLIGGFFIYRTVNNRNIDKPNTIEVLDNIVGYDYNLEDRDHEIYKNIFLKLKDLLEKNDIIDEEKYATYLAQLFLIDLYTIENKISKYDVGSLEFIYPEEKEKFGNKVMDTLYKLVLDDSSGTRNQELPEVTNVKIKEIENTKYKKGDTTLNGYLVYATITYKKDLGYDKNVAVTLVKEDNKMYVVNLTNEE